MQFAQASSHNPLITILPMKRSGGLGQLPAKLAHGCTDMCDIADRVDQRHFRVEVGEQFALRHL